MERVATPEAKRAAVPARVPVQEVVAVHVLKLAPERKDLAYLLKMVAYRTHSALVRLVAPHCKRAGHEGRTLSQSALAWAADIEATENELRIVLAPISSAPRAQAIAALCQELNRTPTFFPGTQLRPCYGIRGSR